MTMHRAIFVFSLGLTFAMMLSGPVFAQGWAEYVNVDARFGINFPGEPVRSEDTYRTNSGTSFPAEVFTASDAAGTYSVTIVDYEGASDELRDTLLDDALEVYGNRGGEVTYEGFAVYDGMDSMMMQISNEEPSRSFLAITIVPRPSGNNKLYIVEGRVGLEQPVPGHFQKSLFIVDENGDRIRYNIDIEGSKFRVVPGTGGQPLLTPQCAIGLPCVPGRT
jgi:hypothetical protein